MRITDWLSVAVGLTAFAYFAYRIADAAPRSEYGRVCRIVIGLALWMGFGSLMLIATVR